MPEQTPQELIAKLSTIHKSAERKGLVIAYPRKSHLLYSTDPDKLEMLTLAIRSGGKPLAWFGLYENGLRVTLLPEYEGQEWAKRALEHIFKNGFNTKDGPPEGSN